MEAITIINKLKGYILNQVSILSKTNPLISFTKPLITRVLDNNISKAENFIQLLADKDGNIDINGIMSEMMDSVVNTKPFTVHTSFIGDINIGDGKVILNIPFTDKNIIFNKEDLEELKNILTSD